MPPEVALPRVELEVSDFGPIAQAKIDLRPLTVFIGPSNTGKSYLATLIYALHLMYTERTLEVLGERQRDSIPVESRFVASGPPVSISHDTLRSLGRWASVDSGPSRTANESTKVPRVLPTDAEQIVRAMLAGSPGGTGAFFEAIIDRCFGASHNAGNLVRKKAQRPARVVLRSRMTDSPGDEQPLAKYAYSLGKRRVLLHSEVHSDRPLPLADPPLTSFLISALSLFYGGDPSQKLDDDWADNADRRASAIGWTLSGLADAALPGLVGPLAAPAFFLPAARTGVMDAHRFVLGTLAIASSYAGMRETTSSPSLSGIHADFIRQLVEMKHSADDPLRQSIREIGAQIERTVLAGTILEERTEAGYPEISYRSSEDDHAIPLSQSSSMVSELAPIVLYIKNLLESGDTLIIEEPESHLHPAAQSALAIQLVRLVNAGVRIIVTTHSEWMLDQFDNQLRMSNLPAKHREGLPGGEAALDPAHFGAWFFEPKKRPRGTVVRELAFDEDEGGIASGYDEVADAMYNEWATIGNRRADIRQGRE